MGAFMELFPHQFAYDNWLLRQKSFKYPGLPLEIYLPGFCLFVSKLMQLRHTFLFVLANSGLE